VNNVNLDANITVATLTLSGYTGTYDSQSFDITVSSNFSVDNGAILLGTSVVTMQGDMNRTGGSFTAGTSTIQFTGGKAQTLTPGGTGFYHVRMDKTGGEVSLGGALDINGNFTITAGTVDVTASNYTINIAGDWTNSGGFRAQSSTVTFDGTGTQNLTSGGTNFYHLEVNKTGGSVILADALDVDRNLTLTNGTLDTSSSHYSINMA